MSDHEIGSQGDRIFVRTLDFWNILELIGQFWKRSLSGIGGHIFSDNIVFQSQHDHVFGGIEVAAENFLRHLGKGDCTAAVLNGDRSIAGIGCFGMIDFGRIDRSC